MLLSVERPFVGAFAVHIPRATLLLRNGLVQAAPPASVRTCANGYWGSPGTWENLSFPRQHPGWRYRVTNSRPWRCTRPSRSEIGECNRGTAKRRKRSAVGWAAGSHSVLIVPRKLANSTQLEPVEGGETPDHGTVTEKHDECLEIREACPRNRNG